MALKWVCDGTKSIKNTQALKQVQYLLLVDLSSLGRSFVI